MWSSGKIITFDARSGKVLREIDVPSDMQALAYLEDDGGKLAIGGPVGWAII